MRRRQWIAGLILALLLAAPFGLTGYAAAQSDSAGASVTLIRDTPTPGPSPTAATTTTPAATATTAPTNAPTAAPTATAEPVIQLPVTGSGDDDASGTGVAALVAILLAVSGILIAVAATSTPASPRR